jgi:acyl-CoA synthetase (AMP-forming)/AMP-acid ligase II
MGFTNSDIASIPGPTPLNSGIAPNRGNFPTLTAALDYAATGRTGFNFHDARANLVRAYPYAEMREDALAAARRMMAHGLKPGDRLALLAETGAEFASLFFGALYAGVLPVPLPMPTSFGGRESFIDQLRQQMTSAEPSLVAGPDSLHALFEEAARDLCPAIGWSAFAALPESAEPLPESDPDAIAYLQYSSGSTRFPHGVAVTHRAVMANLRGQESGIRMRDTDRCVSWLPWYHDMGLVGCMLAPLAGQMSVDYLSTEDFARRPLSWLTLISRNPGTSLSFSPSFGYDICARRISTQSDVKGKFDLSRWRLAGNGADMIGPRLMEGYFRKPEATSACLADGWLDTGDMGYMIAGHLFIVGRVKDMIILNGRNHWPQDIEWAIEQLEGFKAGDIAAFSITLPSGEEAPAVLVQCRSSDPQERLRLKEAIRQKVRHLTGMSCIVELVPPRTLPRTTSGKLSRSKARALYLAGEIVPLDRAA